MKVGYLGPKGTFSYEASCNYYKEEHTEKIPFYTIRETMIALNKKEIQQCIVPIENSLQGCVTETIDTLIENQNIYVIAEEILEIKQNLMAGKTDKIKEITQIYSHPQALAQCREFIFRNFKSIKIVEVESTALAAKKVMSIPNAACIGSLQCMEEYQLQLIKKDIQDHNSNKTRFWILSNELNKKENKKMSLIFSTLHKPGALYEILAIFDKFKINLTKIESRPAKTKLGEYYFLVDIELNEKKQEIIQEIRKKAKYCRILGTY